MREAVTLLHQHGLSQLPVISAGNGGTVIGAVGERGLLRHAAGNPGLLDDTIEQVMEPPFPSVSVEDPVRAAIELLVGEQQALAGHTRRYARGHRHADRSARSARELGSTR